MLRVFAMKKKKAEKLIAGLNKLNFIGKRLKNFEFLHSQCLY